MDTAFNAEKTEHCSVLGALAAGETLRLRLVVPRSFGVSACTLYLTPDGAETERLPFSWESTDGTDEWWGVSLTPPAGLYFYHFSFETSWGVTLLHRQPGGFSAEGKDQRTRDGHKNARGASDTAVGVEHEILHGPHDKMQGYQQQGHEGGE